MTPVAFLLDYAHGWEPATFWPNSFVNWQQQPDRFLHSDHEQMLQQWLWAAYFPIGPESEKPITAVNEVYVPGIFGDIFDCIFAYPEIDRWSTIDTYPAVAVLGDIELTEAEGQRLNQYVEPRRYAAGVGRPVDRAGSGAVTDCLYPANVVRQTTTVGNGKAITAEPNDCPVYEYHPIQVHVGDDK